MTRTSRKYNRPRTRLFKRLTENKYFPMDVNVLKHAVICMGHCSMCKDRRKNAREKTEKKRILLFELKESLR